MEKYRLGVFEVGLRQSEGQKRRLIGFQWIRAEPASLVERGNRATILEVNDHKRSHGGDIGEEEAFGENQFVLQLHKKKGKDGGEW